MINGLHMIQYWINTRPFRKGLPLLPIAILWKPPLIMLMSSLTLEIPSLISVLYKQIEDKKTYTLINDE